MIQKNNVFMKVQEKYPRYVTCFYENNWYSLEKEFRIGVYKKATEEVQLIVKSARKFYGIITIND